MSITAARLVASCHSSGGGGGVVVVLVVVDILDNSKFPRT